MNQLKIGIKEEKEHSPTYDFIKKYFKKNKKFPKNSEVYRRIAKDHLKEDKKYYSKLKKAKL